jgi:hypothetical protein
MSGSVISHHEQHRKRGDARCWTARRIGVLIVAAAAIMAASWLAPDLNRPAVAPPPPQTQQLAAPAAPSAPAELIAVDAAADLMGAPTPRTPRAAPRRTGIPLNADAALQTDGYEILSAAELDGISQARD